MTSTKRIDIRGNAPKPAPRFSQEGGLLLEVLVAVLVFSIGVLGLVVMQGTALQMSSEARARASATYLANQLVAQLWLDRGRLSEYGHMPDGSACKVSGAASPKLAGWLASVESTLPAATADHQQVQVSGNQVTITLCWKPPKKDWQQYELVAYVSGGLAP
jgi:type IV pilus assembly protein PilV